MEDLVLDYEFYTEGGAQRFRELSRKGLVTAFLYSDRIYKNGEGKALLDNGRSARIIAKGGVMYAPVALFTEYFSVRAEVGEKKARLTLPGKEISCDTLTNRGIVYINPITVAGALGIPVSLFYDDMLLALGDKASLDALSKDSEAINAAAYITLGTHITADFREAHGRTYTVKLKKA